MKSNLLVTGGAGYIGSHVCRQLSEQGHQLTVLDNLSTGFADSLLHNERLVIGDINDETLLNQIMDSTKFDGVFHFAASIVVPESVKDPIQYYENNTIGTIKLLKASLRAGVKRFIFSSTAAVYGDTSANAVKEDDRVAPENPYGRSKLMDEWILKDVALAHPLSYIILRYFNVAGADPQNRIGQKFPNASHLVKVACETALGIRDSVTIYGDDYDTPDGTGVRDYIHVEDLASAHVKAYEYLCSDKSESGLFNCGYGHGFSVKEVFHAFEEACQVKLKCKTGPRRPGDVASLIADNSKIKSLLGWQPQFDDLAKIVKTAFDWEKKWNAYK
jgi:UDP-glucose 4-epimerase